MTNKIIGAGIIAIDTSNGKILLCRRGDKGYHPNCWASFGGTYDAIDGHPKETAKREFWEETKVNIPYKISKAPFDVQEDNIFQYYLYIGLFDSAFDVQINEENLDYGWYELDELPENLHPGFALTLQEKSEELKQIIEKFKKQIQ